jgi:hypothetical protein
VNPLPIWTNPDEDRYMGNVGEPWKTPEKIAEYTDTGFVRNFPDSYRICDKDGGDFGFRAPPSFVLNGNWRTVLTRKISDVLERVDKRLEERNCDPCPPFPLTRLSIHGRYRDRPWLGEDFIAKFNPEFIKAMGWPRWCEEFTTKHQITDCALHLRVYPPGNGWAVIGPRDIRHAGTTSYFCAVPRAEAVKWVNDNANIEV